MYFKNKIFFLILLWGIFLPVVSSAAEIRLEASKVEVKTKEEFIIHVIAQSNETINAIEGTLSFSSMVEIIEVRDGNSSLNFWIEKPHLTSMDTLEFSGITPGGFAGVNNHLFSLVMRAKEEGIASVIVTKGKALKSDGRGTEEELVFRNTNVSITRGDGNIRKEVLKDVTPPEYFTPIIGHDPSLYNDMWFVTFATQDKGSGISHYEIKEYRFRVASFFLPWKIIDTQYVLSDQKLKSRIFIRAVDSEGNIQIAEINPTYPFTRYQYILYWTIMISVLVLMLCAILKIWKSKKYE